MAEPLKIDAHMHMYRSREHALMDKGDYHIWEYGTKADVIYSSSDGVVEDCLKAMEVAGVSRALVVNLFVTSLVRFHAVADLPKEMHEDQVERETRNIEATMGERLKDSNAWVCDEATAHPQLVPFIAVDPGVLGAEETQSHLHEMVERHGARGIKIHPVLQQFSMADRRMWPVYSTCVELGIPIIAHSGPSRGTVQHAEPRAFAEVLAGVPQLRLVLAHMGGGVWGQIREIAEAYPNACFDCSEIIQWTGGSTAASARELAQLIQDVGSPWVMMGSDFPWYDMDHNVERVMELPLLSREE